MAVTKTPRLGINRWSADGDPFTRSQMDGDHALLDNLVAIDLQGTLAARPASGTRGRYYFATDNNLLYRDEVTGWRVVGHGIGGTVPSASSPSDTAAEGTSNVAARADHRHAREAHGAAQHTDYLRRDGGEVTGAVTFTTGALLTLRRYSENVNAPAAGATTTLDCTQGMTHTVTLTQNTTLAITGIDAGAARASSVTVILKQDATGGRTVTWPTGTKWPDGVAPVLGTGANAVNVVTLLTPDGGTTWYGYLAGKNMA